jgi:N-acetylmuramoyl-L-alanine amidase
MREIKYIVLHCTATPKNTTVQSIMNHWSNVLGWKSPGYHYIITPNGTDVQLADISKQTNGVKGHNKNSIHISYIGGQFGDDRTEYQKRTMAELVRKFKVIYPKAQILGHCDFSGVTKSCPNFNVKQWLQDEGIYN